MALANARRPEVLAAAIDTHAVATLAAVLGREGVAVDVVRDRDRALERFLERGGHGLLVLGPDLTPALAREIVRSLRSVDPELRVVVFGPELLRGEEQPGWTRLAAYHPASRAAAGAVLRLARGARC